MRVAFVILRKNYYRLLGPAVAEGLARGHAVECWHDWSGPRTGPKGSEFPDAAPPFREGAPLIATYRGGPDLAERWRMDPPDAVVSIDPPDPAVRAAVTCRWVWLQYGADILFQRTPQGVADADAVALYSEHWRRRIAERFPGPPVTSALVAKGAVVGVPELDAIRSIDGDAVRRRLGLPAGRPIVLYLPFPLRSNPPTPWLRNVHAPSTRLGQGLRTLLGGPREYWPHVRNGWNDRRLVQAVRAFCDANGALLVVKTRAKDPAPRYAARLADRVLYDPSHHPPTILELLSTSALCVHHYSTAVLEAASAGVPSLCLAPGSAELGPPSLGLDFVHNGEPGGLYRAPGVGYWRPLAEAFEGLAGWKLGDFRLDPEARRAYVDRFLGWDDGRSSARLLDLVERVARGGPGRTGGERVAASRPGRSEGERVARGGPGWTGGERVAATGPGRTGGERVAATRGPGRGERDHGPTCGKGEQALGQRPPTSGRAAESERPRGDTGCRSGARVPPGAGHRPRPAGAPGLEAPDVAGRLEAYYTRYYRDELAIPGWRDLVRVRLHDGLHEGRRLARLERALGRCLAGLRLLNVGCGTGGFNEAAERAGVRTWGVDIDGEAVAIARARLGPGRIARAAAEALPFRSGAFHVVYCYSTLEHVADAPRALAEMARVLRPGGALYLHAPSPAACFESHYKVVWVPGLPGALGRAYLGARGRPTAFLSSLRLVGAGACIRALRAAGIASIRVLDGDSARPVGGALWPMIRLYYRLFRIRPHVELVAVK
jgi:SAM-dependent methyltransferase